jgi:hypothetical protein
MQSLFPETPWSLIAQAADGSSDKQDLLRQLLERYWQPVYSTMRLVWNVPEREVRDLVQTFLGGLLDPDLLASLDPQQTRFRDFLKAKLHEFMTSRAATAGHIGTPSRRLQLADLIEVPASTGGSDEVFDEQWMLLVIHRALARLEQATRAKQSYVYQVFAAWDVRGERPADDELARALNIEAAAVQPALQQSRRMFRRFVAGEVSEYAGDQDHAREELQWLLH